MGLAEKTCVPCRGGVPPYDSRTKSGHCQLRWTIGTVVNNHHIEKDFKFS